MTKGHITVAVNMEIIPIEMDFTHTRGELSRPVARGLSDIVIVNTEEYESVDSRPSSSPPR